MAPSRSGHLRVELVHFLDSTSELNRSPPLSAPYALSSPDEDDQGLYQDQNQVGTFRLQKDLRRLKDHLQGQGHRMERQRWSEHGLDWDEVER